MRRNLLAAAALAVMLVATPALSQSATAIALVNGGRYGDAVQVLTAAAERNDVDAQVMLGLVYLNGSLINGQEVKMDLVAANYWFSAAAAQGSAIAQFLLAKVNAMGFAPGVAPVVQAPTRRYNQP